MHVTGALLLVCYFVMALVVFGILLNRKENRSFAALRYFLETSVQLTHSLTRAQGGHTQGGKLMKGEHLMIPQEVRCIV